MATEQLTRSGPLSAPIVERPASVFRGRGGATLIASAYLSLGWLVAPAIMLMTSMTGYDGLVWVMIAMTILLVAYEWQRLGHPLTPAGIVGITGLLVFALRPLTVANFGVTTAGARLDSRFFTGAVETAGNVALAQVVLFYAVFGAVYFLLRSRKGDVAPAEKFETTPLQVHRAGIVLVGAIFLALLCAAVLIQGSGGVAAYLEGLSFRSSFLSGQYFLTLAYIPLSVALIVYVLIRRACPDVRPWSGTATVGAGALLLSSFITGARGPLLLSGILPLLLLKQSGPRKFSGRALALLGIAILAGAMVMSLVFRENAFDDGASLRQLQADPVNTLLDRLTSGAETRPFDSLILLNEVHLAGDMPFQLGWTYLAVPLWFIPGSLVEAKGGANTWFTSTYIPRFYYPERIETSISAMGEGFANFGYYGIVLVAVLLAVACAKIGLRKEGQGIRGTALSIMLTPVAFSFVRSDAYQTFSVVILIVAFILLAYRFSMGGKSKSSRSASGSAARALARGRSRAWS